LVVRLNQKNFGSNRGQNSHRVRLRLTRPPSGAMSNPVSWRPGEITRGGVFRLVSWRGQDSCWPEANGKS